MSLVRVLVVEDFVPVRRFITETLQTMPRLQVVGEVSDGLDAVQKAEELRPDLIVLDIGLPTLSGIEAARRIRKLAPDSKIVFLSQESSADVVQEALGLGARGYVVKARAGTELLAAIEAVLLGNEFVSSSLESGYSLTSTKATVPRTTDVTRCHEVQFYPDDPSFVDGFIRFIEPALQAGDAVIVVATEPRRNDILQRLQERGLDLDAAVEKGTYISIDVDEMLSAFMVDDLLDPVRFLSVVGDLLVASAKATEKNHRPRVAACGECASILWARGNADAAIEVERLCNQLTQRYDVDILCGFPLSSFPCQEDQEVFERICLES